MSKVEMNHGPCLCGRDKTVLETEDRSNHRRERFTALLFFCHFHQFMWGMGGFQVRYIKEFPHKKPVLLRDWFLFKIYRGPKSSSSI